MATAEVKHQLRLVDSTCEKGERKGQDRTVQDNSFNVMHTMMMRSNSISLVLLVGAIFIVT